MPGTPAPVGVGPNGLPKFWNATLQAIQGQQQATNGLASGAPAGWVTDSNGNVTSLSGANLNQVVTIGAAYQQAGVLVSTGIASGTAGQAVQSGPAITTITLTKGSTAATVGTVTGASLAIGQVIGAALVTDPTTGTPTSAITPGTTIANLSGLSVTLSQNAAESGTSLYCAAARFVLQQDSGWVALALSTNWNTTSGYASPAFRIIGDCIFLRGNATNNTGSGSLTPLQTFPAAIRPSVDVLVPAVIGAAASYLGLTPAGNPVAGTTVANGGTMSFDGTWYPLH